MKKPRPPKKMTRQRIRNVALAYVQRYGGASARLRLVLSRRAQRSLRYHDELDRSPEVSQWVEEVIADLKRQGLLDDGREARVTALRLSLAGRSRAFIRSKLRVAGFSADHVDAALLSLRGGSEDSLEVDPDWVSCCRFARRRGLGPFQRPGGRERSRDSQLAALLRAGFSFTLARRVLDERDPEVLEAVIHAAPIPSLSGAPVAPADDG